jgi:polysaccharide export outer membrane protein
MLSLLKKLAVSCILITGSAWSQSNPAPGAAPDVNASKPVTPQRPLAQTPVPITPTEQAPDSKANAASTTHPAGAPAAAASADLRIGVGDLLEVAVFGAPDFNKQVRVLSSGDVSLPLIGSVHLAGLTTAEAEKVIEKKLSDGGYFTDPQVSIFEKEYQAQGISVLGEVQKPGIYPMLGPHRLFDVISVAGGTTPKASNKVTVEHRGESSASETLTLAGDGSDFTRNNPEIVPGDTVVVLKAPVVYVVGDVRMPGGYIMDKPELTVLQALAMAQGANPTAKLDQARLLRKTGGEHQEVPLALNKILASKAPDVPMQADDILFLPSDTAKTVMRKGLEAIVQTATGVAIYRH